MPIFEYIHSDESSDVHKRIYVIIRCAPIMEERKKKNSSASASRQKIVGLCCQMQFFRFAVVKRFALLPI